MIEIAHGISQIKMVTYHDIAYPPKGILGGLFICAVRI